MPRPEISLGGRQKVTGRPQSESTETRATRETNYVVGESGVQQ